MLSCRSPLGSISCWGIYGCGLGAPQPRTQLNRVAGRPVLRNDPFAPVPKPGKPAVAKAPDSAQLTLVQAMEEGDEFFLCLVSQSTEPDDGEPSAAESAFSQKVRAAVTGDAPADLRLRVLLLEKEHLFPDQLPATLPPDRGLEHLRIVLECLERHQFYCKLSKCEFFTPSGTFLGHIYSSSGWCSA